MLYGQRSIVRLLMRNLPELPDIKDATSSTLRLENSLAKRLPTMPQGALNDMSFSDYRRESAEQLMNDMRASFSISRQQSNRSRALARAKNRSAQRQAEAG